LQIFDEEELKTKYRRFIEKYQAIFKHLPEIRFTHIVFKDSVNDFWDFRETFSTGDVLEINTNFRAIAEQIIEFTTILSFIQSNIRRNDAIYNLLYVFYFQNVDQSEILAKSNKIINEMKGIFQQIVQARVAFVDMAIKILPLQLLLSEFLYNIKPNISKMELIQHLRVYFLRYNSSFIDIAGIKSVLQQPKIVPEWFNYNNQKKYNSIQFETLRQSPNIFATIALHYEKIGLNLYFIHVQFTNSLEIVHTIKTFFLPVPFFTVFNMSQNKFFTFYATMPENGLVFLERFLTKLKNMGNILDFKLTQALSSDHTIQFNRKYSGKILLSKMKQFNSKKYNVVSPHKKKNTPIQDNLIPYQDTVHYSKKIEKLDSNFGTFK
jgi:hypothetical protein